MKKLKVNKKLITLIIFFILLLIAYLLIVRINKSFQKYSLNWWQDKAIFYHFIFPKKKIKKQFPKEKMGRHRVETIEDANKYSKRFKWLEIDIHFCEKRNIFIQSHDHECEGLPLDDFINGIVNKNKIYFWLDFKNYNIKTSKNSITAMNKIVKKFNLKQKIFIESTKIRCIYDYGKAGYPTIYWVSTDVNKVKKVIKFFAPTVLSAPYNYFDYLSKNFPDQDLFFWTNGLIGEKDKKTILNIKNYSKTKVIILDYEYPF